jgi:endoglucanase
MKYFAFLLLLTVFGSPMIQTASAATSLTESANNTTLIAGQGGSIVDGYNNSWTIVNGVVKKNGINAGYSANVIQLAYVNDVVWQENASLRWWSWSGSKWSGGAVGTGTPPVSQSESANNSVLLTDQSGALIDAGKNLWTVSGGVVKKNNVNAGYTANVLRIAYVDHVVWQENTQHLWWKWTGSTWLGNGGSTNTGLTTSPLPAPVPVTTPTTTTPTTTTPSSPSTTVSNPFAGKTMYKDDWSNALDQAKAWGTSRPTDAAKMQYLADQPSAVWFGDWNSDIQGDVDDFVDEAAALGHLPILVAYNIPDRDCGDGYSAGGVSSSSAYHDWIVKMANGIGDRSAVVILEPDAVALDCFDDARGAMLTDAVNVLEAKPNVSVYIDAGHPNWTPASTMADRLNKSGIAKAQGFALNVSNFYTTQSNIDFGNDLSSRVGGKHYVIDTSRNHNGWQGEWCNPQGAGIGARPTTNTGVSLYDAGLWVKDPGGSDGYCNGGPAAGHWWADYAVKLYDQGTH